MCTIHEMGMYMVLTRTRWQLPNVIQLPKNLVARLPVAKAPVIHTFLYALLRCFFLTQLPLTSVTTSVNDRTNLLSVGLSRDGKADTVPLLTIVALEPAP